MLNYQGFKLSKRISLRPSLRKFVDKKCMYCHISLSIFQKGRMCADCREGVRLEENEKNRVVRRKALKYDIV